MNQITDDILKGASNYKKKVIRTTAQLPIFRDSSNLLFLLMKRMYHVPGKMVRTLDTAVHHADEINTLLLWQMSSVENSQKNDGNAHL